jgi:hypothetical protein
MNEGTTSGVGCNKLNSFSVEDPAQRPLTFFFSSHLCFTCPIYYLSIRQHLLVQSIISLYANSYLPSLLSPYMPTFTCPTYYLSTRQIYLSNLLSLYTQTFTCPIYYLSIRQPLLVHFIISLYANSSFINSYSLDTNSIPHFLLSGQSAIHLTRSIHRALIRCTQLNKNTNNCTSVSRIYFSYLVTTDTSLYKKIIFKKPTCSCWSF